MHSPHVSKSTSTTATSTSTTTTVTVSGVSQPESLAGQRPKSYFMGHLTTPHTPELTEISSTYYQQDERGLLSEIGTTQTGPFEALATHQAVTFDDDDQGQSASSLSLSTEPSRSQKSSQSDNDVAPIVGEEQSHDTIDKWILMSGDEKKPFHCGYKGCSKKYIRKTSLRRHFLSHIRDSKLRCYLEDCTGTVKYPNKRALTRHIHTNHTNHILVRPFECEICNKRFKRTAHLKYHREHVHPTKSQKIPPNPQNIYESSSAATATITASISTMTSRVSQPELTVGQRQQGPYVGISTTTDTSESMQTAASYHQQDGLRLLAEVSTSQINPFVALATHQTVTFDNEAVTTGIAGVPNLPSDQYQAEQSPDPTDTNKWIIVDKSQERPYLCGFPECDKNYKHRNHLVRHFTAHTGVSKYKCTYPECVDEKYFLDRSELNRHIVTKHTFKKPFQCDKCNKRFTRKESLDYHSEFVYCIREKRKSPKRKRK